MLSWKSRGLQDRNLAALLLGAILLALSPLPASLLGTGGNLFFLAGCFVFLVCSFAYVRPYDIVKLPIAFLPFVVALPTVLYWRDPALLSFLIYFVVSVLVLLAVDNHTLVRFSHLASRTMLIVALGAWVGFLYALAGGGPMFSIENPDGRVNDFFLTTFSNWSIGNLIRPAGIFDEPGTLSFVICFVAALRNHLGQSRRLTWQLLLLGLITTSLAHVVYMLCHAAQDRQFLRSKMKYLLFAAVVGVVAAFNLELPDTLEAEVFFSRFVVEDGRIGGDTRSDLLSSALERINGETFLFGLDSDCITNPTVCARKDYGLFGETPAGLVLLLGIFMATPYFYVVLTVLWRALRRRNFSWLGLFLLLLQRPYVETFGYSLLILLVAFSGSVHRNPTASSLQVGSTG
jgi:hypothetical protein